MNSASSVAAGIKKGVLAKNLAARRLAITAGTWW